MNRLTSSTNGETLAVEPFTFLAFNINPEGIAAVLPGAPAKTQ